MVCSVQRNRKRPSQQDTGSMRDWPETNSLEKRWGPDTQRLYKCQCQETQSSLTLSSKGHNSKYVLYNTILNYYFKIFKALSKYRALKHLSNYILLSKITPAKLDKINFKFMDMIIGYQSEFLF